jgi:DNA-binding transcriptional ArsR family regulator
MATDSSSSARPETASLTACSCPDERAGALVDWGPVTTDVFAALASPVRREILGLLLDGPQPVNALATRFDMRRPSVSEHLRVLRDAGLVTEQRAGRQRFYRLQPGPLAEVRDWLTPYERFWRDRLRNLREMLDENE